MWTVKCRAENECYPYPEKPLYCPLCGNPILLHDFRAYRSTHGFYYCDVHAKCTYCGLYLTFGIPLDPNDYNRLVNSRYHGKIMTKEIQEILSEIEELNIEDKKRVSDRLACLGYW